MILVFELDLDGVKLNQLDKYPRVVGYFVQELLSGHTDTHRVIALPGPLK